MKTKNDYKYVVIVSEKSNNTAANFSSKKRAIFHDRELEKGHLVLVSNYEKDFSALTHNEDGVFGYFQDKNYELSKVWETVKVEDYGKFIINNNKNNYNDFPPAYKIKDIVITDDIRDKRNELLSINEIRYNKEKQKRIEMLQLIKDELHRIIDRL